MQTKVPSKQEYAIMLRLFINHKRVLEKYSSHYKKPEVAKSMRKCYNIYLMVKDSCNTTHLNDLCKHVIINEADLRNILPAANNTSYQKQSEKLQNIINIAKSYLNYEQQPAA